MYNHIKIKHKPCPSSVIGSHVHRIINNVLEHEHLFVAVTDTKYLKCCLMSNDILLTSAAEELMVSCYFGRVTSLCQGMET